MNKKLTGIISALVAILIIAGITVFSLVWNGIIILNGWSAKKYEIKGIDVSSYQGEIDWQTLSKNDIFFAYIKATEGSSFVDKNFAYNFSEAQKTDLHVGAYHFFSYDSSGETQAQNFIENVIPFDGMLPPVIDLEFYGDKEKNPPDRMQVEKELSAMINALENHYHQKPLIYATEKSYQLYLANVVEEYDIWIRNVISKPKLSDKRDWTFWQYTNREMFDGYNGEEKYIDVNVFYGNEDEYKNYLNNNIYKN